MKDETWREPNMIKNERGMINPRFVESKSNRIGNEWLNFSRMHALMFWKSKILFSWTANDSLIEIKKTLFRENGLSEGWPEEVYKINDTSFTATLKEAQDIDSSFSIIAHPASRALDIVPRLEENRDNCASTWSELTGKDWREYTFKGLLIELNKRKDLLIASHWWCPQEYCLLLHVDSYERIFRADKMEDVAWWLGEKGIQMVRDEKCRDKGFDASKIKADRNLTEKPLGILLSERILASDNRRELIDEETYEIIQETYQGDAEIYGRL